MGPGLNATVPASRVLQVDDLEVEVTVRRVKRMNLGVHPPDGRISLSVPLRTSDRAMVRFVRECRAWIEHHRARIIEEAQAQAACPARPARPVLQGVSGEIWWCFGQPHRLTVHESPGRPRVAVRAFRRLEVRVPDASDAAAVLAAIDRWQRRALREAAEPMLAHWCERIGVRYAFLGVRRMSTRWGSCVPARGRIWLNVALTERHPALLEYVVVHEVVHLVEGGHGARFRALMDTHLPEWRDRRALLDASS